MKFFDKISYYLKNKNIKLWHVLMASLVMNAFALLSLSKNLFIVFLLLTINVLFLMKLANNSILYNNNDKFKTIELKLKNITEWFILITIALFINKKYKNKMTPIIFLLFSVIIILNTLDYIIKNNILSNIKLNKLEKYSNYFNNTYTFVYLLILLSYVNYKK